MYGCTFRPLYIAGLLVIRVSSAKTHWSQIYQFWLVIKNILSVLIGYQKHTFSSDWLSKTYFQFWLVFKTILSVLIGSQNQTRPVFVNKKCRRPLKERFVHPLVRWFQQHLATTNVCEVCYEKDVQVNSVIGRSLPGCIHHASPILTQNPVPEPSTLAADNLFSVADKVTSRKFQFWDKFGFVDLHVPYFSTCFLFRSGMCSHRWWLWNWCHDRRWALR